MSFRRGRRQKKQRRKREGIEMREEREREQYVMLLPKEDGGRGTRTPMGRGDPCCTLLRAKRWQNCLSTLPQQTTLLTPSQPVAMETAGSSSSCKQTVKHVHGKLWRLLLLASAAVCAAKKPAHTLESSYICSPEMPEGKQISLGRLFYSVW